MASSSKSSSKTKTTAKQTSAASKSTNNDVIEVVDTSTIKNVGLASVAKKLQDELRSNVADLLQVTQSIKQLNSRKRELESKVKSIKSELQSLCVRESSLAEFGRNDFEWSQNLWYQLENVFNIKDFRSQQLHAINATMSKIDCLLIMPTGGGKSLCFQLPAILSPGITIVVSPLISLMEDQYHSLRALKIPTAIFNSNTTKEEARRITSALNSYSTSDLKLIYVTPEKIAKSKRLMSCLEKLYSANGFARLVIDEVHCCSQWGHDFRPDYKFLSIMKKQFPNTPILGLTATATPSVIVDVQKMLNIESSLVFKDTFFRPTLIYEVLDCRTSDKINVLQKIIERRFKKRSSGIIYCLTVKDTEEVVKELSKNGIRIAAYHAYLSPEVRSQVQKNWYENKIQVIAATIAFGMGINKLDLDYVIHYSMSKSVENYYQESGRAGRDGRQAYCILLFNLADVFRASQITMTEKNGTRNVYNMLKYCLDQTTCRKKFMSEYFGDAWDSNDNLCSEHCDNCVTHKATSSSKGEKINVKPLVDNLVKLIEHAADVEQRMTHRKFLEALYKKGPAKLRVEEVKVPKFPVEVCEVITGRLLLDEYLQEEFHFTPYSTISYIMPGTKTELPEYKKLTKIEYEIQPVRHISVTWEYFKKLKKNAEEVETLSKGQVIPSNKLKKNCEVEILNKDEVIPNYKVPNGSFVQVESDPDNNYDLGFIKEEPDYYDGLAIETKFLQDCHQNSGSASSSNPVGNTATKTAASVKVEVVDLTDESGPAKKKFKFKR